MFDRLIAGAGAITDAADRAVRAVLRSAGSHAADRRPGSVGLAVVLLLFAGAFLLVGLESRVGPLRTLTAGAIPDDASLGDRVHATVTGHLASTYVETFFDVDGDGLQGEGEEGQAWAYWMVDPETRTGVTVLSLGAPWEVFQATYSGMTDTDPDYVAETVDFVAEELAWAGVTLDPEHLIDATVVGSGGPHDLTDPWPGDGATVTVSGSRLATWGEYCSKDPDGDGYCDDEEVDIYDVVVMDHASGVGVLVITDQDPSFQPVTFTGLLRRDATAVMEAVDAPDFSLADYDISVSSTYVLDVGKTPPDPATALALALVTAMMAMAILLGLAGGYIGYRPVAGRPTGATTMAPSEAIPLRLTGVVRSPAGPTHVRDVPATLRRFVLRDPTPSATGSDEPDATSAPDQSAIGPDELSIESTLIVERVDRPEGVALGIGELQRLSVGSATTFRGARPALRATAGTGPLILSFEDVAARDRAAAELVAEAGLDLAAAPAHPASTMEGPA